MQTSYVVTRTKYQLINSTVSHRELLEADDQYCWANMARMRQIKQTKESFVVPSAVRTYTKIRKISFMVLSAITNKIHISILYTSIPVFLVF